MTEMTKVWRLGDDLTVVEGPRRKVLIQDEILTVGRIQYQPGEGNEFHFHDGTSQALYVIEGEFTVRTQHEDGTITEKRLHAGDCALVGDREHEQFVNTGETPALVWQVTHTPGEVVRGRP
jgi:mannose-6-phosphate isomerase-like protein (cupin superfamily)